MPRTSLVRFVVLPVAVAALAVPSAALAASGPGSATAPATTGDFYAPPSPLRAAAPGTVIRDVPAVVDLGTGAPATDAWTVMYHSRTTTGKDDAVTGTVIVPTAAWTGTGARPVVSFAVGTQGLAQSCAPSKQLVAGSEYEDTNIALALDQGWAVAVTDYEGYTTGSTPTYTTGRSEGHAVLDIVRAATHIHGSGVAKTSPLALWGYSQGGGASAWAAALQPTYAPGLDLVADASGGVPADLASVNEDLNGNIGAAFMLYGFIGGAQAYPKQLPLYAEANAAGLAAIATIKTQCVAQSLTAYAFVNISNYLTSGMTLAQFDAQPGVAKVLKLNDLGTVAPPQVPVYQYHGSADEIVNIVQAAALHSTWCSEGVQTTFTVDPGDHVATDESGAPGAVAFLASQFAGDPFVSDCLP